jgi:hypothetical protein
MNATTIKMALKRFSLAHLEVELLPNMIQEHGLNAKKTITQIVSHSRPTASNSSTKFAKHLLAHVFTLGRQPTERYIFHPIPCKRNEKARDLL